MLDLLYKLKLIFFPSYISPQIKQLIKDLANPDKRVQQQAYERLLQQGNAIVDILILEMRLPDNVASYGKMGKLLGEIGASRVIPILILWMQFDLMYSKEQETSNMRGRASVGAIIGMGQPAIPPLLEVLDDFQHPRRREAIIILGNIAERHPAKIITDALVRFSYDEDIRVRAEAAAYLKKHDPQAALKANIALLRYSEEKASALSVLIELGDAKAIPAIIPLLKDTNSLVRARASIALGKMKATIAVPELQKLIVDHTEVWLDFFSNHQTVAFLAASALQQIGTPEALESVQEWQTDYDIQLYIRRKQPPPTPSPETLFARRGYGPLETIRTNNALPSLTKALHSADAEVVEAAIYLLKQLGTQEALNIVTAWEENLLDVSKL